MSFRHYRYSPVSAYCNHDHFLPTPVPGAFRKRRILPRPKKVSGGYFFPRLRRGWPFESRTHINTNSHPERGWEFILFDLDTIDVIHWTQIRPPYFYKNQIFRSQVSTDTWIRFTGGTFFKVYHTSLSDDVMILLFSSFCSARRELFDVRS